MATVEVRGAEGSETRFRVPTKAAVGERVVFCVRPEHVEVGGRGVEGCENRFQARVENSEFLGEATRVHLDREGRKIRLRTTATDVPDGIVELGFDPADVHVLGE